MVMLQMHIKNSGMIKCLGMERSQLFWDFALLYVQLVFENEFDSQGEIWMQRRI